MDTKRLDLNLLATLEALLEEKNVTKAAARLHLSQPTVSAQLSRLRDMFNDPLLIPVQRGMIPTAKALELRSPLHSALDQVRGTLTTHQHFEPTQAKLTLILTCTDYLQTVLGLSVVKELRRKAPNIRVGLRNLEPTRLKAQMADGEVDLAFMTPKEAPPDLRSRYLYDEIYVLVGRRAHPHIFDGMMIEDYVQLEHVVVSLSGSNFYTSIDQILEAQGQSRKVVLSAASFLLIPDLVAQSNLVALVPQRLVAERKDLKVVESPIKSAGFSVGMVWHERNHGHSAHRWIREVISQMITK
ncbi:LysR family transcriptional regulator [Alteromonas sp. C1M14]|uniref:LysR family transcriptional regulator n=1 Tax=Alteromonas sp. C1M14 TaxID=2841567 RepID=UPI001C0974A0|nr:LysR family transcriptional regulator [Alteromonas sp. C1M14]